MKRVNHAIWLAAGCVLTFAGTVRAEIPQDGLSKSRAAFQALDALVQQTLPKGELPRLSDPQEAEVLRQFFDSQGTLGAPPYTAADLPVLFEIAGRAGAVQKAYVLFAPQPGQVPDMAANTAFFQDEIAVATSYNVDAVVAGLLAISDFLKTLPADQLTETRIAGLRQVRLGLNEMVTGTILMLRSPDISPDNRAILLGSLVKGADAFAGAMTPVDRAAMVAQVDTVLPGLTGPEAEIGQDIRASFGMTSCSGLCALD